MRPLGCELYDDDLLGQGDPGATHYRTLALQRVERGDGEATMLTIRYDDGQDMSTKHFVVSLDKSLAVRPKKGWKSQRESVLDESELPFRAVPDDVDEIIDIIQKTATRRRSSVWTPGLIEECVDDYFKKG